MKKIYLLLFSTAFVATVHAQTSNSHLITLNLSNALELNFTSGASGVGFTFNNVNSYQNGLEATSAATIQVKSNRGFNVSVKTSSANFSSSAATVMPVSNVLFVRESSQPNYISLSTTEKTFMAGQTNGIKNFGITYKAAPGFNYDGGVYTVNVVYTATQQ
jgi:hypothetical protein